jgi:serine/threonine-protein kinase
LPAVLYEALCGQRPFSGYDPFALAAAHRDEPVHPLGELQPSLHPALTAVTHRALAKDPERRYPDATTMRQALAQAAATVEMAATASDAHTSSVPPPPPPTPPHSVPPSPPRATPPRRRGRKHVRAALVAGVLALVAVLVPAGLLVGATERLLSGPDPTTQSDAAAQPQRPDAPQPEPPAPQNEPPAAELGPQREAVPERAQPRAAPPTDRPEPRDDDRLAQLHSVLEFAAELLGSSEGEAGDVGRHPDGALDFVEPFVR